MAPGCPRPRLPIGLGHRREPRPASSTSTVGCRAPPSTGHSACLCGGRIHLTEQLHVLICEALLHVDVRLPAQKSSSAPTRAAQEWQGRMCSCGVLQPCPPVPGRGARPCRVSVSWECAGRGARPCRVCLMGVCSRRLTALMSCLRLRDCFSM